MASINSARNRSARRQSQASVASALKVGNDPLSAKTGFKTPDRHQRRPGHAEALFDFCERLGEVLSIALPLATAPGVT